MADLDEGKTLRILFDVPDDFPTHYASNLVSQYGEHDFTIVFFDIRPPLLVGPPELKAKQLEGVETIKAQPLARIVIAASRMHEFVQVLQDNLKAYQERKRASATAEAVEGEPKH